MKGNSPARSRPDDSSQLWESQAVLCSEWLKLPVFRWPETKAALVPFQQEMSARLADAAHKAVVGVLVGTTIVGLVDIGIDIPQRPNDAWDSPQLRLFAGFMHRSIMSQGKDEIAKREMVSCSLLLPFQSLSLRIKLSICRSN